MNVDRKTLRVFLLLAIAFALIAATLYSVVLFRDFDWKTHLFDPSTNTYYAVLAFLAVCVVFFMLFPFFRGKGGAKKEEDFSVSFPSPSIPFRVVSFLTAALLLGSIGNFLRFMFTVPYAGSMDAVLYFFRIATNFFAIVSTVYFLRLAFSPKPLEGYALMLSFAPVLWSVFLTVGNYYDKTVRLNSPIRVIEMLAVLVLIFCQLIEARVHMGKKKKAIFYYSLSFSVIFLCPAVSLPHILRLFMGLEKVDCMSFSYFYLFFLAVYFVFRLFDFLRAEKTVPPAAEETL